MHGTAPERIQSGTIIRPCQASGADTRALLALLRGGTISPVAALRQAAGVDGEHFEAAFGLLASHSYAAAAGIGSDIAQKAEQVGHEDGIGLLASAMTDGEKEVLAVVSHAGGVPKGHGSRVFGYRRNRSFRPTATKLAAMGLLDTSEDGLMVTGRGRDVLALLGKEEVGSVLKPYLEQARGLAEAGEVNQELRERMLTAVMGSLRVPPVFGDRTPAAVDSAVVQVLAARGSIMTVELIDMVGVPGLDVRASVERLDACGVAGFGRRYRSEVAATPGAASFGAEQVDPEMAEAWLFAHEAREFHMADLACVRAAMGRGSDARSSLALIRQMVARGHLSGDAVFTLTDTGEGFAGWLMDELVSGHGGEEGVGLPARVLQALANPARAVHMMRGGEERLVRSLPCKAAQLRERLEEMAPEEAAQVACDWPFPPDRHDRRQFATSPQAREGDARDGIERTVLSFLSINGPASVAEIATASGQNDRAVAEGLADLAAARLVLDASEDAARRSTEWREFCQTVLEVIEHGRLYAVSAARDLVPGAAFADVKAALRYLERRGALVLSMRCSQKMYALPGRDSARALPRAGRGANWERMIDLVSSGPCLQGTLSKELGVSGERVRQMAEILVAEGRLRSFRLGGKGRARCLALPGTSDQEVDFALTAKGLPRRMND